MRGLSAEAAMWAIAFGPLVVYAVVVLELATRGRGWRR